MGRFPMLSARVGSRVCFESIPHARAFCALRVLLVGAVVHSADVDMRSHAFAVTPNAPFTTETELNPASARRAQTPLKSRPPSVESGFPM